MLGAKHDKIIEYRAVDASFKCIMYVYVCFYYVLFITMIGCNLPTYDWLVLNAHKSRSIVHYTHLNDSRMQT